MKILVAVKRVAALEEDFEIRDDGRDVDPDFLNFDLNEWDDYSLETAVQIKEAAGDGVETGRHAATITGGAPGVLHGARSYLLQDEDGQTVESHSISAGLDYPGVGPEHAWLHDTGRAQYRPITDTEAMDAFRLLCRTEGIIPAIESAHALAGALQVGRELGEEAVLLVNLSGRGDKDVDTAARWFDLL